MTTSSAAANWLPVVRAELDVVCRLADDTVYTDQHGIGLHTVIVELAQLVGWIASDAGYYRHAEQAYLTGAGAPGIPDQPRNHRPATGEPAEPR